MTELKIMAPILMASAAALALAAPTQAGELSGRKAIALHRSDGGEIPLGTVTFKPQGNGTIDYDLAIDTGALKTFFLSMRDFKCAEGPEIVCFVPYPYQHPHTVTAKDLAWLEHDLLFFWKKPNDYGAKLGNGLYFALSATADGLNGTPQAIDLDRIASPPADLTTPPYPPAERDDISAGSRWIDRLIIR